MSIVAPWSAGSLVGVWRRDLEGTQGLPIPFISPLSFQGRSNERTTVGESSGSLLVTLLETTAGGSAGDLVVTPVVGKLLSPPSSEGPNTTDLI